jgi:predicted RNA-binding Zn-ribbon protein involved in translation (DUF1610 family)
MPFICPKCGSTELKYKASVRAEITVDGENMVNTSFELIPPKSGGYRTTYDTPMKCSKCGLKNKVRAFWVNPLGKNIQKKGE